MIGHQFFSTSIGAQNGDPGYQYNSELVSQKKVEYVKVFPYQYDHKYLEFMAELFLIDVPPQKIPEKSELIQRPS